MKKYFFLLISFLTFAVANAQITTPAVEEKPDTDSKYFGGAVPEVDGKVVLQRTVNLPAGISTAEVMKKADEWMTRCSKDERVLYTTRLPQTADNVIQQSIAMELTFSKSFISHDFCEINYALTLTVKDGKIQMEMSHIGYKYNENNKVNRYSAEEMISDKYALNKKKTKMVYGYKKFRMKTIDLFDELQASLNNVFNR